MMPEQEDLIRICTSLLRQSCHPFHVKVRELMRQHGVDLDRALVVSFSPEGRRISSGALVTETGQVYEFWLAHQAPPGEEAALTSWQDVTGRWQSQYFAAEVTAAREMLARGERL